VVVTEERSAALLVRVWLEDGDGGFRARVTAVGSESSPDDRTIALAASPGEVIDAVSGWLEAFESYGTGMD
jgi:hypothetical protein